MELVIGGLAGAGATIFTNPMDVIKTRMQLQGELQAHNKHTVRYRSTLHALYLIAKTDGVLALQKGLVPAMFLGFSMNSVRLGTYHIAEVQGWTRTKDGEINIYKTLFWACASGFISGFAANPPSVVKTRIQAAAHPSIAVGKQYVYNGMIDGIVKIYKTEGILGFFAGVNATCVRLGIGSSAQLTTFSTAKEVLLSYGFCKNSPTGLAFAASCLSGVIVVLAISPLDVVTVRLYNQGWYKQNAYIKLMAALCLNFVNSIKSTVIAFLAGTRVKQFLAGHGYWEQSPAILTFTASLVSGIFCVLLETPLDVVNIRLLNQGSSKDEILYKGVFDCLRKTYKAEGIHGLYKGIGPLYCRLAPQTTLSLVIWDMLNELFEKSKKS